MTNHVHLILDPGDDVTVLGRLMKRVAGVYTRYVNRVEHRTGTVWNGRYKSSLIDTQAYLMSCCRYVDLNPLRARMVTSPGQYEWSSYNEKTGRRSSWLVDEDMCYRRLGRTRSERHAVYRRFVSSGIDDAELDLIRSAVQRGQLTGKDRFIAEVERKIGRRVERRGPGRPTK
jgi:putative transposase